MFRALQDVGMSMLRVGILDDHRSFGEAIAHALTAFDDIEPVGITQSIEGAVEMARNKQLDVLLLDYQLATGTGIECAERIASEGIKTRMVLLTAHASPDVEQRAYASGIERVLSKEAPLFDIADAIRSAPPTRSGPNAEPVMFSRRQREVLELMGQGLDPSSIAEQLFISVHTARSHVKDVLRALGASSQLSAVTTAIREGYLLPPRKNDARGPSSPPESS